MSTPWEACDRELKLTPAETYFAKGIPGIDAFMDPLYDFEERPYTIRRCVLHSGHFGTHLAELGYCDGVAPITAEEQPPSTYWITWTIGEPASRRIQGLHHCGRADNPDDNEQFCTFARGHGGPCRLPDGTVFTPRAGTDLELTPSNAPYFCDSALAMTTLPAPAHNAL